MKKQFGIILVLALQFNLTLAADNYRVYSWEEALKSNPSDVLAISFERLKLDSIPSQILQFKRLRKLDFSKNKLTALPDFIHQLDSLEELDLSKNKFFHFPVQLCAMKQLKKLILSRNAFTQIPDCIQYMSQLSYLDLSDTPVGSFPEAFVSMTQLRTLVLNGLSYPSSFQLRWKERLPWMRIEFDAPCHCME